MGAKVCETKSLVCDDWLAAWFYQQSTVTAGRESERKGELCDGSVSNNTAGHFEHAVLIIVHKHASNMPNGCHTHQICYRCITEMHNI